MCIARSSTARARRRGATGNAAATVTAQLHDAGDHTRVTVDTDLKIVGKLAQFGSSMLQQVSEKLLGQFVDSLEAKLASESAPAAPVTNGEGPKAVIAPEQQASEADRPHRACGRGCAEEVRAKGIRRVPRRGRGLHPRPFCELPGSVGDLPLAAARCRPGGLCGRVGGQLRAGGVGVSADGPATLVQAMHHVAAHSRTGLYWAARLSLVNRAEDIRAFDSVFNALFDDAFATRRIQPEDRGLRLPGEPVPGVGGSDGGGSDGDGVPWTTLPRSIRATEVVRGWDGAAGFTAQQVDRACRRIVRSVRRRRSSPNRYVAGAAVVAVASTAESASGNPSRRQANRREGVDAILPHDGLGGSAAGTHPKA